MGKPLYSLSVCDGPILATAIHEGSNLRPEVASLMSLSSREKLYEEDPYTSAFIPAGVTSLVNNVSRFEVDINRSRESAVYITPAQSWGLKVWKAPPPKYLVERSLAIYDEFYSVYESLLREKIARWGMVIVIDLHSYNHMRDGAGGEPAPSAENPQVNLGTRTMPSGRWDDVKTVFMTGMAEAGYDVRENVKFGGGNLARWTHEAFPDSACVLSVEFKKVFMDEWTGVVDEAAVARIASTLERVVASLADVVEGRSE